MVSRASQACWLTLVALLLVSWEISDLGVYFIPLCTLTRLCLQGTHPCLSLVWCLRLLCSLTRSPGPSTDKMWNLASIPASSLCVVQTQVKGEKRIIAAIDSRDEALLYIVNDLALALINILQLHDGRRDGNPKNGLSWGRRVLDLEDPRQPQTSRRACQELVYPFGTSFRLSFNISSLFVSCGLIELRFQIVWSKQTIQASAFPSCSETITV